MRFQAILRILGAILGFSSMMSLPALLVAVGYDEWGVADAFLESFLAPAIVGFAMWFPFRNVRYELRLRDGFLIVTGIWFLASIVTALPFMLAPPYLSFTDAFFESSSGLTTTGATVIVGLDDLPKSVLFFRQSLNFYGGMGIVILAIAILPMLRVGGMQLFRAESTGPVKDAKLTPRIAETAKALWLVYAGLVFACSIAYWLGGMSFFDAVSHALATIATGGFSTHDASFAYWDSALIDCIAIVFMTLGGVNFGLHFIAWRRASTAAYGHDSELKSYLRILGGVSLLTALTLWFSSTFDSFPQALRHATFQTVSNMTTTGFTTTGFTGWPSFIPLALIMIGFVGGSSGSTSGGMKVARVIMAVRQSTREVKQLVHPHGQFLVKMGGRRVSESIVLSVGGFCTLYVLTFVVSTLALATTGADPVTAFSAAATTLNNMGPGLGSVAVNFQELSDAGVWVSSLTMIIGRLEVFTVLVLLTPAFWRE